MYHKAKCRARLVTRITSGGDIIHVTSNLHTHPAMYTSQKMESRVDAQKLCLERNPLCVNTRSVRIDSKNTFDMETIANRVNIQCAW
ncbi:uncharacterized protein LOC108141039 isoform X1 [Drosophila elegans]|uniref:uncharacterized protein LOC108141039 isoform X1 n=1 Tax=Drosophila elegans TaxID=30023 RepID=UPI0007E6F40F|nr:uncharacterized protein LOC108141039 isoform X1 [Drosophila elegans]XP_041565180.1 uncharacterized protein LOC108141039 isoform X1 [Drosophila elegans]